MAQIDPPKRVCVCVCCLRTSLATLLSLFLETMNFHPSPPPPLPLRAGVRAWRPTLSLLALATRTPPPPGIPLLLIIHYTWVVRCPVCRCAGMMRRPTRPQDPQQCCINYTAVDLNNPPKIGFHIDFFFRFRVYIVLYY